jgi:hypothetical protein
MKKYVLLILLAGTAVMIVVMTKTGATLKTTVTPKGILDLEFANTISKAMIVTRAWAPAGSTDNINAAKINTYLDFIFLIFYSLFLFFTCKKIGRISSGSFGKAGMLIAKGALIAGFLDILENAGMLYTLSGHLSGDITLFTTTCSRIKWGLALIAVLYCLSGLVYLVSQQKLRSLLA